MCEKKPILNHTLYSNVILYLLKIIGIGRKSHAMIWFIVVRVKLFLCFVRINLMKIQFLYVLTLYTENI